MGQPLPDQPASARLGCEASQLGSNPLPRGTSQRQLGNFPALSVGKGNLSTATAAASNFLISRQYAPEEGKQERTGW